MLLLPTQRKSFLKIHVHSVTLSLSKYQRLGSIHILPGIQTIYTIKSIITVCLLFAVSIQNDLQIYNWLWRIAIFFLFTNCTARSIAHIGYRIPWNREIIFKSERYAISSIRFYSMVNVYITGVKRRKQKTKNGH